ncbi:MAG TPA: hypothetical protein PLS31_10825 [Candidatus Sumerlaeota bacterium]|nr:MAG: hypothetical protein BWY12_01736 [candidate division BRC1 bacterium ADurb.Bin183]HQH12910.1 hypothetical protein [Candidatus Sumerlaeota bacterium]HRR32440.1 hypothetical protein [Candidatus Sumerlaeia bacterium]HRR99975.1 hypothetical protein [Candidatus Sumerlaeia bacterium]
MGRLKNEIPTGVLSMKIPLDKLARIDEEAQKQGRPRANLIKFIIDQYLANLDEKAGGKGGA